MFHSYSGKIVSCTERVKICNLITFEIPALASFMRNVRLYYILPSCETFTSFDEHRGTNSLQAGTFISRFLDRVIEGRMI